MSASETFSEGRWAVDAVLAVQSTLRPADDFFNWISTVSNPALVVHYVVPLLSMCQPVLALEVLVVYVAADVTNLLLKWPLQGDRPFWMDPSVRQFGGNTCEVGFGMPSGHMQVCSPKPDGVSA